MSAISFLNFVCSDAHWIWIVDLLIANFKKVSMTLQMYDTILPMADLDNKMLKVPIVMTTIYREQNNIVVGLQYDCQHHFFMHEHDLFISSTIFD